MDAALNDDAVRRLLVKALAQNSDTALFSDPDSWTILRKHSLRFGLAEVVAFVARAHVSAEDRLWCDRQLVRSWDAYSKSLAALEFVLGILQDAQIEALCLKGPLLALRHYQPPFVRRPSVDLDIAVRERDAERACAALEYAGYSLSKPIREALSGGHDIPLIHSSRTRIELHVRLSHSVLGLSVDEFIDRSITYVTPNGIPARILEPADELLHLALHVISDRFRGLFHLFELHRLWMAAPAGVRAAATRRAVSHRYIGILKLLDVAFRVNFGDPLLPENVDLPGTWLGWQIDERLYRQFEEWSQKYPEMGLGGRLIGRWIDLQLTDGPSDALHWMAPLARLIGVRLRGRQWGPMRPANAATPQSPRAEKPGT